MNRLIFLLLFSFFFCGNIFSQKKVKPQPPLSFNKDGKLVYLPDSLGNRIPDFSYAGYMAGEKPIPNIETKTVVPLVNGDATTLIQAALDYVGSLKPDANGFRGTVLLQKGMYKVSGSLLIRNSGVVLRGSGVGENGTQLIATGKDRRTLIRVLGEDDRQTGDTLHISDSYVPVNSFSVTLSNHSLKIGDKVLVVRPSTKEWIDKVGTEHFGGGITSLGWKVGGQNIVWDRTVVSANAGSVSFDAPLTTALDKEYGGGYLVPYSWQGRISNVGVENMTLLSEYDEKNLKDEAHSWMGVTLENVSDAWVRNITFKHFAGSAVMVLETAKCVTVENCKSLQPVSEIGGQRRYTFFTMGQQCLFQRLYAESGYHDFGTGFCAPGPNVFLQCHSELPYSFSGAIDSWASGVLFDIVNVNGNALSYKNRMQEAQGAGWTAANSVFWQCSASLIENFSPPTAQNWAFGSWSEFSGDDYWNESNNHIKPRSLYYQQLKERLGEKYIDHSNLMPTETEASSSPPVSVAMELTKKAYVPALTLTEWIDKLCDETNIPIIFDQSQIYNEKKQGFLKQIYKPTAKTAPLSIENGWIVRGTEVQTGFKQDIRWWSGSVQPAYLKKNATPHLTRFVPGRTGMGLTDDVDSVVQIMKRNNFLAIDHNYGLWYDRRRDDHERIRRINGEVWPPFYEQPFARSGEGTAYDGLSKYDLTKYNDWYWMRLRQFADLADQNDLVLMHQNYFQHNIIEAGAHWTDSPWRPANNINNTGFPEPAPYAGDKRIFLAEQFYDINHPVRRELHRKYIRQCLDNFKGNNSVIQFLSEEYTGPLHFVEFWLDVIAEWKMETGEKPMIALSATKDVQDAILNDPVRSEIVDVIDIKYWFHREDGTTYEPKGGQNLAPRQHARLTKPGKVSFASIYRAVSEYRTKYPEKAVAYFSNLYPQFAWASFMAGGSMACLPEISDRNFLSAASSMKPIESQNTDNQYVLGNVEKGYIIYTMNGSVSLDIESKYKYDVLWINSKTGKTTKAKQVKGGGKIELQRPSDQVNVAWLVRKY
ncbi:DUF6298 domain-containing protein [Dysgonomonas sp. 520]|uniref:DUF6298 domain-containing protein n=1 Tax=Dysgonomonas sp. 520 TaxID=2302931 RepID=UPI001C88553F|nr:DUF6298 domain-containing protein [Dysgonomonas sp. 520]